MKTNVTQEMLDARNPKIVKAIRIFFNIVYWPKKMIYKYMPDWYRGSRLHIFFIFGFKGTRRLSEKQSLYFKSQKFMKSKEFRDLAKKHGLTILERDGKMVLV